MVDDDYFLNNLEGHVVDSSRGHSFSDEGALSAEEALHQSMQHDSKIIIKGHFSNDLMLVSYYSAIVENTLSNKHVYVRAAATKLDEVKKILSFSLDDVISESVSNSNLSRDLSELLIRLRENSYIKSKKVKSIEGFTSFLDSLKDNGSYLGISSSDLSLIKAAYNYYSQIKPLLFPASLAEDSFYSVAEPIIASTNVMTDYFTNLLSQVSSFYGVDFGNVDCSSYSKVSGVLNRFLDARPDDYVLKAFLESTLSEVRTLLLGAYKLVLVKEYEDKKVSVFLDYLIFQKLFNEEGLDTLIDLKFSLPSSDYKP